MPPRNPLDATPQPPPEAVLPAAVAVRRSRAASALAWLGLAGFGGIFALVRARRSEALDLAVTIKLQGRRHPAVETLMRLASWPGFPPQSRLIPPIVIASLVALRLRLEALFFIGAWGTALVASITKALMRRPRPVASDTLRVVTARLGGSSFPSGHVISYVGVYGFLAYLAGILVRPVAIRRALVGGLLGLVALVGPSRIHQGHHWFTDVTASYMLGTSYVIGLAALYRRVKAHRTSVRP
ncbi:MAG TPA: phosphatase PAP2 family protein [Clostridia bacterium]|nr:phosphatase PAP2 family protein [Clostridia bacterium]